MKHILVVGSINMDLVVSVDQFVKAGETKESVNLNYFSGGKGANQAVAARLSGANVRMIGAVGKDAFAQRLLDELNSYHIDTKGIVQVEGDSGLAIITVTEQGENQIILNAGANHQLVMEHIKPYIDWEHCHCILLQNEIRRQTIDDVIRYASSLGIPIWFNPAPATMVNKTRLKEVNLLIVNEVELATMTEQAVDTLDDAKLAMKQLKVAGASQILLTMGERGSLLLDKYDQWYFEEALHVEVLDTTAAGDTFIGSLASEHFQFGSPIHEAMKYATAAAAISLTSSGAQASIPSREAVVSFLHQSTTKSEKEDVVY